MLQSVWYNKEQLDIFMHALTREHDTVKIGIIGQSISSTQSSLQSSINNFDQFFTQNNQPTVTITINQSSSAPVPRVGGI